MISTAAAIWEVARAEIMQHVRSKRVYIIGGLFFATFLLAAILGQVFKEQLVGIQGPLSPSDAGEAIRAILLFYFGIGGFTFVSVLALSLSADRICGEWKNRSLFLLLSKPITRSIMLGGKTLGAFLSVAGIFVLVFFLGLGLLIIFFGFPDAESWGSILGGLGIVIVGLIPFVGLGILCSAMFRSPVASFIVALGLWFLVFPLIGIVGTLIDLFRGVEPGEGVGQWFALISPNSLIQTAQAVWLGGDRQFDLATASLPEQTGLVMLAMLAHVVVYLGLSFWIVNRRDYD